MTRKELIRQLKNGSAAADLLDLYRAETGELYFLDYDGWDLEPLDAFGDDVRILCIAPNDLLQKRDLSEEETASLLAHVFVKGEVLAIANCNVEAALYFLETLPHPLEIERLENPMEQYADQFGETYAELTARKSGKFSPTEFIRAMMCTLDTLGYLLQEECDVRSAININRAVFQSSIKVQCIVGGRLLESEPLAAYRAYYAEESADFCAAVADAVRPMAEQILSVINAQEMKNLMLGDFSLRDYVHLLDSRDRNLRESEMLYEVYAEQVKAACDGITEFLRLFYTDHRLTVGSSLRPIRRFREDEQILELSLAGSTIAVDTMKYFSIKEQPGNVVYMILDEFRSRLIPVMEAKGIEASEVTELLQNVIADQKTDI